MDGNAQGQRRHARVDLEVRGVATLTDRESLQGEVSNISLGGLCFELRAGSLPLGTGVTIELELPPRIHLRVAGRVVWQREADVPGAPRRHGIEFFPLAERQRALLTSYIADQAGGSAPALPAAADARYKVEAEVDDELRITLNGTLSPAESEAVRQAVCERLRAAPPARLYVWLDLTTFAPCDDLSQAHLSAWLSALRERPVMGIMVGPSSVGMLQFKRIARSCGVADVLLATSDPAEARTFWGNLRQLEE